MYEVDRGQSLAVHRVPSHTFSTRVHIYLLLVSFRNRGICCHLGGPFVSFLAGVLESYRTVTVYVALTDHPLLKLIFQPDPVPIPNFNIETFDFEITFVDDVNDIIMYNFGFGDITIALRFIGINALICGTDSNIDFIYFTSKNFESFNFGSMPLL
jgi:hypothetical protein